MSPRYDQCDSTCTVDCGHCKGAGKPDEAQALRSRVEELEAELAEFRWVRREIVTTGARSIEQIDHHPDPSRPHRDALSLLIDLDGWGGLMHVCSSLSTDLEREPTPVVRWDIPLYRAEALLHTLDGFDEIGDLFDAGAEHPGPWTEERRALAEALEHMVRTGRAVRDSRGDLTTTKDASTSVDDPEGPTS